MGVDSGTLEARWDMNRFSDCSRLIRFTLLFGSTLLKGDLGACWDDWGYHFCEICLYRSSGSVQQIRQDHIYF